MSNKRRRRPEASTGVKVGMVRSVRANIHASGNQERKRRTGNQEPPSNLESRLLVVGFTIIYCIPQKYSIHNYILYLSKPSNSPENSIARELQVHLESPQRICRNILVKTCFQILFA